MVKDLWSTRVIGRNGKPLEDTPAYLKILREYNGNGPGKDDVLRSRFSPARGFSPFPYIRDGVRFEIIDDNEGLRAETKFFVGHENTRDKAKAAVEGITTLIWEEFQDGRNVVTLRPLARTNVQELVNQLAKFGGIAVKADENGRVDTVNPGDKLLNENQRIRPTVLMQSCWNHMKASSPEGGAVR